MPKIHHLLAIKKSLNSKVDEKVTAIYKGFQKPDLFNGHVKTWQPMAENVDAATYEKLPDERKNVQLRVEDGLKVIRENQTDLYDLNLQIEVANGLAKADVVVDGTVLLKDAPVTYLLWLGHQLDNLHTEIKKIPTLDAAERWGFDGEQNLYATKATETVRTKKLQVPLVLHPATKEHPAQVQLITEDVRTGSWNTIKYSAAMPTDRRDAMLARVEKLQHAVKQACETANETDIPVGLPSAGKAIHDFVLAP